MGTFCNGLLDDRARAALAGSVCAFGVFDGLHLGHRHLIDKTIADALSSGAPSCILTFDRDPDELFRPAALKKLMSNDARLAALRASGVDEVVALPFDEATASLSPDAFLGEVFGKALPKAVHLGRDARFGAGAAGGVATLETWAEPLGCRIVAHELLAIEGAPVTASRVRALLERGRIEQANRLIGRAYCLEGVVVEGRREGREMGFRTANLEAPTSLFAIGEGVYAAYAFVDGARYKAAVSVGVSPTFAEATAPCEAHLLDFEGDLYGQPISLEFRAWLRPMKKFDDVDELIATVMGNIAWVRENL